MKHLLLIAISLLCFANNVKADSFISPTDNNIRYVGRVTLANSKMAKFSFSGTQIRAVFEGTSLKMKMKPNSGYYMVELDDKTPFKVHCSETDSIMPIASGLSYGKHNVCITMVNEGYRKKPEFHGFLLDDNCSLPEAPVLPTRKIEFIGNSITCGYGIEGKNQKEHFSFATENQYYSYDGITGRNLNAQCMVVARSGIGVYRNCGGKVSGDKMVMPDVYPYTLFGNTGEEWDFSKFTPDVVCINLGTNDTSYNKCDSTLFVTAFYEFLRTIRSHYHDAPIVLLSGTMITAGSTRDVLLRHMLDEACEMRKKEGDKRVYRLDLTPEDGSMGWGSDYHPSRKRQEYTAQELTKYLKDLMKW